MITELDGYVWGTAAGTAFFMTLLFGGLSGIAGLIVETNRDPAYLPPPRGTGPKPVSLAVSPTGFSMRF